MSKVARRPALAALAALAVLVGCGAGSASVLRPRPWPRRAERNAELLVFAHRLFRAMTADALSDSELSDEELSELFLPDYAAQLRIMRRSAASPARSVGHEYGRFRGTTFDSACIQGATVMGAPGPLGLVGPGATFDRVLIAGRERDGGRWAAWVEGIFVRTTTGVRLVQASRFERPRRDHADLELAPCDIRVPPESDVP